MAKLRMKDMIREAEEAMKNAPPEGDAKANAQRKLDFLKEMSEAGFTVNQDGINDTVAAETKKVHDEWEGVVGSPIGDTKELMESLTEEDLEGFAGGAKDGEGDDDGSDGSGSTQGEANVLRLMREGLSERDAKIADLEGKYDETQKQNSEFQKTIMGDRLRGNLLDALKGEGLNKRYTDIAIRNAQYDTLLEDALAGNEPDGEKLREIAQGLKQESGVWFQSERDPRLDGVDFTPPADELQALTDEQRAEAATPVF